MAKQLGTLEAFYVDELRDLYHAETQLAEALPEMAQSASSKDLAQAFARDAERTRLHLQRLQDIFLRLQQDPSGHKCKGMEGLLQEGRDRMQRDAEAPVLDAGLVVMAQKAQHYEIAGYGSACTFARLLDREDEAQVLHRTLEEEKLADAEFTEIAQKAINLAAATA